MTKRIQINSIKEKIPIFEFACGPTKVYHFTTLALPKYLLPEITT
jgi:hypothetical protein